MSKFLICECCNQTYLEEDMSKNNKNMCCCCWCYTRPKDKRIAELEKQLKNAIVPKFKGGQYVWCVYPTNEHRQGFVFELEFVGYTKDKIICRITDNEEFEYDEVFATKEKAEAKLKELGESDVKD
jgi:hypothetical protein